MNSLRNKVQLIGNLGNDPEIITLESGKKLAKFSLATNESYKDADGQKQTKTDWHNLVAWGKTCDIIEKYVTKGKEVAIEGKLTTRSWEDKDGMKRYITEVIVNELLMLGNKQVEFLKKDNSNREFFNQKTIPRQQSLYLQARYSSLVLRNNYNMNIMRT